MTPYIEAKKAEIAQKFRAVGEGSVRFMATREEVLEFFSGEIDTLLDEIESRVVPSTIHFWDGAGLEDFSKGYNDCQKDIMEKFQHLRTGVETE